MNPTREQIPPCTVQTPWGPAQSVSHYAEGLDFYTTAGHGGLHLSLARWEDINAAFKFRSWAGPFWLEEDEDFNLAVIFWPALFTPAAVFYAVRYIQEIDRLKGPHYTGWEDNMRGAREWLASPAGLEARTTAAVYAREIAGQWERGSMSTCGHWGLKGWVLWMHRNGETREAYFEGYPEKSFYTDAEIAPRFEAAVRLMPKPQAQKNHETQNV